MIKVMKPRSVDAHRGVSWLYIWVANNEKPAPKSEHMAVLAMGAEAATKR